MSFFLETETLLLISEKADDESETETYLQRITLSVAKSKGPGDGLFMAICA